MNGLMRAALWVLLALGSDALAAPAEPPPGLETFVDRAAAAIIASGESAGLSVGVAKGGETWLAKGYGHANLEWEIPAGPSTVYRIGSITKQFTAAAILLLVEDGKLSLDDPLTNILPDYPETGKAVRVRHLLDHTSGIKSLTSFPIHRQQMHLRLSRDDIIARFKDVPLGFDPGSRFLYNNSGYYLLGVVIEKVSGKPYDEFLAERLLEPLGLTQTFYDRHRTIIPNRAAGYGRGWGGKGELRNAPYLDMGQPFAAGSLASSVTDLLKWQHALLSGELLGEESWSTMTTRGTLSNGGRTNYGFGVFLSTLGKEPMIRHGGGINGFRGELACFPDRGITVVVLTNTEGAAPQRLLARIGRQLIKPRPAPTE